VHGAATDASASRRSITRRRSTSRSSTVTGGITAPTEGAITNTTFAAVKIESGTLPAPPAKVSCADLGGV